MPSLFTIGHLPQLDFVTFLQRLQSQKINCVVDVRKQDGMGDFSSERLKVLLKQIGVIYLSFREEFSTFPPSVINRKGEINYNKAISEPKFQEGITRLQNGISKGYIITLLGTDVNPNNTPRFLIISKYLESNGIEVSHFLPNGNLVSHKKLVDSINSHHVFSKESHLVANELGRIGEELAIDYLIENDYSILAHNWNLHHGCELDIIAIKDDKIHFVEVKTRRTAFRSTPEQAINYKKMQNLSQAANSYRHQTGFAYLPYQFDSIAVVYRDANDYDLTLYENVFYFQKRFY